ncbi:MAG: hypothetical protein OHK003_13800 [Anaerolineales bacterium]
MELNFATMTLPTLLLWGLGLLIFLFGGLLGYFNMNIDARKKLDAADQKIEIARAEAERKLADAAQQLEKAKMLMAQAPHALKETSLLRLKNDENFQVQIEMDGQPLTAPLTPERKKRLVELLNHFRPWLEGETAAPQASTPQPAGSRPVAAPLTSREPVPVPKVTPTVKPVPATLTLTPQKPKVDPEVEFKLLSMVKQIDFVLQKRIAGTPLESMGIHLNDTLHGGLEVQIGSQKFETIDDVPNENIKAAIRAAIAEWETKYVPGA